MHPALVRFRTAAALCVAAAVTAHGPSMAAELPGAPQSAVSTSAQTALQRFALRRPLTAAPQVATMNVAHAVDANPPQLRAFNSGFFVDATGDIPQLLINLTATDDASGVYYLYLEATGPNGQKKYGQVGPQYPVATMNASLALRFGRNDAPGLWTITDLEVGDNAGNWHDYAARDIAALGNSRFWVQNSYAKYLDNTAPVPVSGRIMTPVVALTDGGGNGISSTVGITLSASDAGNPAATGVHVMELYFCTLTGGNCFQMQQLDSVEGKSSTTLQPATVVANGVYPAGDYYLYYVHLIDWGGNESYTVGTEFGGTADFSKLLPTGHKITLTP